MIQARAQRIRRHEKRKKHLRRNGSFKGNTKIFYWELGKTQIYLNTPEPR